MPATVATVNLETISDLSYLTNHSNPEEDAQPTMQNHHKAEYPLRASFVLKQKF